MDSNLIMKQKIKIAFSDFWPGFNYNPMSLSENFNNVFYEMLLEKYDIEISKNPDFLIFSVFGNNHLNYNCTKIFYTGENIRPNFNMCDYAITFDYNSDPRHFRFPLSAIFLYENGIKENFNQNINIPIIKKKKEKFCNFLFSNPAPQSPRNLLFMKLNNYKPITSGGRVLNNTGYLVDNKLEFLNDFKFTICFENSQYSGYTTEKIVHPKLINSIPIYWGNPEVGKDWNTKAFINAYDFSNLDDLFEYIKKVDNDDDLYNQMLNEPHFNNSIIPNDLNYKNLLDFFDRIFNNIQ
jgi:hypothetical protein